MREGGASIKSISEEIGRNWRAVNNFLELTKVQINLKEISSKYADEAKEIENYPDFGCGNNDLDNHSQNTQLR